MKILTRLFAVWLIAVGTPVLAEDQAPLGSPDFYPSPEHPVGWRGDGTGRFPGATPPTVWNRRVADITSEIMVQAGKPNGEPGADSHILEYFTVKDWLVAGPFAAPDPEKDIDKDFLDGEAEVEPDIGDTAGHTKWKEFYSSQASQSYYTHVEHTVTEMWVDFVYAFAKRVPFPEDPTGGHVRPAPGWNTARYENSDKQAAYAHTYLYAPSQAEVDIRFIHSMPAVKMWINGVAQRVNKSRGSNGDTLKVQLNKGWNRLLVKAICDEAQKPYNCAGNFLDDALGKIQWRFAAYIKPSGHREKYTGGYETQNISWMLKLTGRNMSQPIVVGDKLFVGSNDTDLFCIDKSSGKILWMHTGTTWDAMTAVERAAVKDKAEPLLTELDKSNAELISLLNANISPQGLDGSKQAIIDEELGKREKFLKSLHDALSTGKTGKLYLNGRPGEASAGDATPSSDGKRVFWHVQGDGGYLTSAFSLDGKLIWSKFEFQKSGTGEHGLHSTPLLYQGNLYVSTVENLVARDGETGKELWRGPGQGNKRACDSSVLVEFNGEPALQTEKHLFSLKGEILIEKGYNKMGEYTPIVNEGVLYSSCNRRPVYEFEAIELPKKDGDKHKLLWKLAPATLYGLPGDLFASIIASPLYVEGLIYQVTTTGKLVVIDTKERKVVYRRMMDGYNINGYKVYGYTASPTLAGKNIYLLDGVGYMTIIKPGVEGTIVGTDILQNISSKANSALCHQEGFYTGMYFDGKRMFLHGDEYLYCIEEK